LTNGEVEVVAPETAPVDDVVDAVRDQDPPEHGQLSLL
jgi:hypothetical protein